MKWIILALILVVAQTRVLKSKVEQKRNKWYVKGMHKRHPFTDGASIGPAKIKVYDENPLKAAPGSVEHETQYWHETTEIKRNAPEPYYNGGEEGGSGLPTYSVAFGKGGQRKAL